MKALGKHFIVELYGCDPQLISHHNSVEAVLLRAAKQAKANIIDYYFHEFSPYGVSGFIIISQSHLSIHTWPEHGYCAIDIFTCSETVNERAAIEYIGNSFKAGRVEISELERGVLSRIRTKSGPTPPSLDQKINYDWH